MRTILVDDEEMALRIFQYEARMVKELEIVGAFENGYEALEYMEENPVELAVLDIQMSGIDGIELGDLMRRKNPELLLIYITGSKKYAFEAVKRHAVAYLIKPYSREELAYAVETARLLSHRRTKRIYAKTFGHFDLYVDGKPIMFHSAKAKELLALLIDREGGTITSDQIIGTLWEDRPNDEATQNLCSKVARTLVGELKKYQAQDILVFSRGVRRIDTELFSCDLYQMLSGDQKVTKQYMGEYMLEYSWAENRMALLEKYLKRQKSD